MSALPLVILVLVLLAGTAFLLGRRGTHTPRALPAPAPRRARPRAPAPASKPAPAPQPQAPAGLDWTAPIAPQAPRPAEAAPTPAARAEKLSSALRERYVAARFPGMAGGAAGLTVASAVIKAARLYYEDGKLDRAQELLAMAIAQAPAEEALWLAQMELAFLARNAGLYIELARAYRAARPESAQWDQICRLGNALVPGETLFGEVKAQKSDSQYGPWPDTPNWIQASWDLTSDVLAADFHQALVKRTRK